MPAAAAAPLSPPSLEDERPAGPPRTGLAAVPVWVPFAALLAVLTASTFVTLFMVGVADLAGLPVREGDGQPPGVLLSGTVVQDIAFVAAAFFFTRAWAGEVRPATFGLRATPVVPALVWSAAIYVLFWASVIVYTQAIGTGPEQRIVTDLRGEDSLLILGGFAVLVGIAAPLVEELFFRGFLFGVLRERIGVVAAAIAAGAIFGLIHAAGTPVRTLGILVLLGIGLCILYVKTGSLLPCMGLHALHNSISFAVTKSVEPWVGLLLVAGSVGVTLLVGLALVERAVREAPA
jgi:membrane protease YdiL (CAAX protease family)